MNAMVVEQLYDYFDKCALYLEKNGLNTYLEGLAEAGENLFQHQIVQQISDDDQAILKRLLNNVAELEYEREDVRKALQLAVLKGMKGAVQPHHSMTPEAVSLFVHYLFQKLLGEKQQATVLDLAVGSGNLLYTLLNQSKVSLGAQAFEVDETLLKLAYIGANLQHHEVNLYHQDSVERLSTPKVDLVVTDLPVGYYPKDDVASQYELKAGEGHSYIHHLMIEQGLNQVKDGGFLLFLVPNFLFESEQSKALHEYLKKHAHILSLLQLPQSMFSSEQFGKSIFVIQKKGNGTKSPSQALLAELPSFSKKEALADMIQRINKWFADELGIL
ncbi:class I SAM-dependent methyltransferase [Halalkalibacter sp. AB-rgal2]|uniref:class I SAM-dependent methyltransferase n=2 Tax=unclassified Halalkalibacter TaxID=2893063 RepID=UPI001FF29AA9|nr:class I SAM-dependent methyltransferase [Halalkalibacter sp. APA_J-10(15)]